MAFIISSKKPLRTTRTFFSAREDEYLVRIGVVVGGIIIVLGEGTLAEREEVVVVVVISFPASLKKME
tara:strand:- start:6003 stop:6206 length:204 start_codon:yes stop_codon:yes gene_type:complete